MEEFVVPLLERDCFLFGGCCAFESSNFLFVIGTTPFEVDVFGFNCIGLTISEEEEEEEEEGPEEVEEGLSDIEGLSGIEEGGWTVENGLCPLGEAEVI